jgi:hypothetical protein
MRQLPFWVLGGLLLLWLLLRQNESRYNPTKPKNKQEGAVMSVTPSVLAVALGQAAPEPGSVTEQQWIMWVDDALMLIETRRSAVAPDAVIDQVKLDYVAREAVVAHIKKPDDATQVTVAIDDASTSKSYKSGKGRVTILDEWWLLLGLTETNGAFAIDMVSTTVIHSAWCSSLLGAVYCSCGADIGYSYEGGGW